MAETRGNSPERRDRVWLLGALAVDLLTMRGAGGEALGFDKRLKASITSSFQPCRRLDCGRSEKSSASSCSTKRFLPIFMALTGGDALAPCRWGTHLKCTDSRG